MAINNEIQVIRALWGTVERSMNEVFIKPIFKNETVIVWGAENRDKLESMGYDVILMSEWPTDAKYSTIHAHFMHKLLAIAEAEKHYNEFLFLDWDCYISKPLDIEFYRSLREGNDVQVPLYAYHDEEGIGIVKLMTFAANERYNNEPSQDLLEYIKSHEEQLRKYSWKSENMLITPNFSFFYSRKPNIGQMLIDITIENNILNCIEEHAFFLYANCSIEEYIQKFEPIVTFGTHNDTRNYMVSGGYDIENDPVIKINKYIETKVNKNIYFKHI